MFILNIRAVEADICRSPVCRFKDSATWLFRLVFVDVICNNLLQEEGVLKGQELYNAVLDANYTRAIYLVIEIHMPHKLFDIFVIIDKMS